MLSAEILKRRGVRSVAWFHTDHWEPWGGGITDNAIRAVEHFAQEVRSSRFGRKATLFYLDGRDYRLKQGSGSAEKTIGAISIPGDMAEFLPRSALEDRLVRAIVGELTAQSEVSFQVHFHHEQFVINDGEYNSFHKVLKGRSTPELDAQRVSLLLKLTLETIRHDTRNPMSQWAIVHGLWALNGSDPTVCKLEREIEMLMENGCWGDFSFPAGRRHCDPTILEQPYTIKPFPRLKCYDFPDSDPRAVDVGAGAFKPRRFLIWNSKAKHDVCSLDFYTAENVGRVRNAEHMVMSWLRLCPVIDRVLYIKTHAHSMHPFYHEEGGHIPFGYPPIIQCFDLLQRACDRACIELRPCSVEEVRRQLEELDRRPPEALHLRASPGIAPNSEPLVGPPPFSPTGLELQRTYTNVGALNEIGVRFLRNWIDQDEDYRRAAGNYYVKRLADRTLFTPYDAAAADFCCQKFPPSTKFFELGSGFGELSILIALTRRRCVGIEADNGRYLGTLALVEALRERGAELESLSLIHGTYPDDLPAELLGGDGENVLLCTNTTSSYIEQHGEEVHQSLRRFDHLVIDVNRFGIVRDDDAQRRELLEALGRDGFTEVASVHCSDTIDIRHFSHREGIPAGQDRRLAATTAAPPAIAPSSEPRVGPPSFSTTEPKRQQTYTSTGALNEVGLRFLRNWIEENESRKRAAGDYYRERLAGGSLFTPYDTATADFCRQKFPPETKFFELGCGFGELSILIALTRHRCVGIEADDERYLGGLALVEALRETGAEVESLSLIHGTYPDDLPAELLGGGGDNVLVCTNTTSSYIQEHRDKVHQSLRRFDHLVIDVNRFGVVRDDDAQRREFLEQLGVLGFTEVASVHRYETIDIRHFARPETISGRQDRRLAVARVAPGSVSDSLSPVYDGVLGQELGGEPRLSDMGMPIPETLLRFPFNVKIGSEVSVDALFPRIRHVQASVLPRMPIRIRAFRCPFGRDLKDGKLPRLVGESIRSAEFLFPEYDSYHITSNVGTFKCLTLDPNADPDSHILAICRFMAENIVHSSADRWLAEPWAERTRYVRPDLLLHKLFLSDQPLFLHCDVACDATAYVLHLAGYRARRVWVYDPKVESGHVVLEVWFPARQRWGMVDIDAGVLVGGGSTTALSVAEICSAGADTETLKVNPLARKYWLPDRLNMQDCYTGQLTWKGEQQGEEIAAARSYHHDFIERWFRSTRTFDYRFANGYDDNIIEDAESRYERVASSVKWGPTSAVPELMDRDSRRAASVAAINAVATSLMLDRIAKLGLTDSGAYNYYLQRAKNGEFVTAADKELMKFVDTLPPYAEYHEVGAGLGPLSMLLALEGRRGIAIEGDDNRAAAASALYRSMCAKHPEIGSRWELLKGWFPRVVDGRETDNCLALFTNVVSTVIDEYELIDGIRRYSAAVIDIDRFATIADTDEQRQARLERFRAAGFRVVRPAFDIGASGRYFFVSA